MEPQIIIPPPVPVPPSVPSTSQEFHKSLLILVLAYIQLGIYVFSLISSMARMYTFFASPSIIFLIPAILIVFTKNKGVYKVSRVLLIIEYLLAPLLIVGLFFLLSSPW